MEIEKSDLKEPYTTIAELIGLENTLKLAETFGGEVIYLPKLDRTVRSATYREIQEKFDGYNFKELAKEYNLSVAKVRMICADKVQKKRSEPIDGQMSVFDFE